MTTKHAKKSKRKNRTTEVRKKKTEDEKAREKANQNAPARRLGPEVVDMYQRSTTQDQRKRRNRDVAKGRSRKPKHKKNLLDRAASAARVARRYAENTAREELPLDVPSTGDELEPCGHAAMFAMEDLLEEDY